MTIRPMATRKKTKTESIVDKLSYLFLSAAIISTAVWAMYALFYRWASQDDAQVCSVLGFEKSVTGHKPPFKGYCINSYNGVDIMTPVENLYGRYILKIKENIKPTK